jgi:hypothetical protein
MLHPVCKKEDFEDLIRESTLRNLQKVQVYTIIK